MAPRSDLTRQEKSPAKAQSIPGKPLKLDPRTHAICLYTEWCFRSQRFLCTKPTLPDVIQA